MPHLQMPDCRVVCDDARRHGKQTRKGPRGVIAARNAKLPAGYRRDSLSLGQKAIRRSLNREVEGHSIAPGESTHLRTDRGAMPAASVPMTMGGMRRHECRSYQLKRPLPRFAARGATWTNTSGRLRHWNGSSSLLQMLYCESRRH